MVINSCQSVEGVTLFQLIHTPVNAEEQGLWEFKSKLLCEMSWPVFIDFDLGNIRCKLALSNSQGQIYSNHWNHFSLVVQTALLGGFPMHAFLEIGPIEHNGIYFQGDVLRSVQSACTAKILSCLAMQLLQTQVTGWHLLDKPVSISQLSWLYPKKEGTLTIGLRILLKIFSLPHWTTVPGGLCWGAHFV